MQRLRRLLYLQATNAPMRSAKRYIMKDLEIARLRNSLKAWIVIATVATGFAVLLAFEVLELRDKLAGVL